MAHFIKAGLWAEKLRGNKGELDLDNLISSSFNFSNGLTNTNGAVKLGGTLTEDLYLDGTYVARLGDTTKLDGFFLYTVNNILLQTEAGGASETYFRVTNTPQLYNEAPDGSFREISFINAPDSNFPRIDITVFKASGSATSSMRLNGNTSDITIIASGGGVKYNADYSANYTTRSLTDKAYVDAAVSDIRLKENVTELPDALEKVNLLRPVEFDMIATKEHKSGFIAQEVEGVFPHMIMEDEGILKIKRDEWIPVLVKAIQELTAEVNLLKAQLNK